MKQTIFFLTFFTLLVPLATYAQIHNNSQIPISINAGGDMPDASAMLDVQSTSKGMLIPRMTTAQRNLIASPATGLLLFDTDTQSFWFFNGTAWENLVAGGSGDNLGDHTATTDLDMSANKITNLADPTAAQEAATKNYVDANDAVDDADNDPSNELQNLSEVLGQGNDANSSKITNLADPTNAQDAATKSYVDANDAVDDADNDPNNELQMLSTNGDTLFLSSGNYVLLNPAITNLMVDTLQVGGGDTAEYVVEQQGENNDITTDSVWQGFTPMEAGKLLEVSLEFANINETDIEFKITPDDTSSASIFTVNYPSNHFSSISGPKVFDFSDSLGAPVLEKNRDYFFHVKGSNSILFNYNDVDTYSFMESSIGAEADLVFSVKLEFVTAANFSVDSSGTVTNGRIKDKTGLVMPVGSIIPFAGHPSMIPEGWLHCNGDTVRADIYEDLFEVLDTLWGSGTGPGTFNLPDLRGRFLRGFNDGTQNDPDADSRTSEDGEDLLGDVVGSYQDDAFQGHKHNLVSYGEDNRFTHGGGGMLYWNPSNPHKTSGPINDGANGDPRTSSETRPKNASVLYIIKY